jgi:signal peptidase
MRPIISRALGLALAIALVGAWFVVLRPTSLGGPASYVFVSGVSMLPTLESGDLVVLHEAESYGAGDVIAFRVPDGQPGAGALVIHRIVGGSAADGFTMRGDNKRVVDEWRPRSHDIAGRLTLRLPGMGTALAWLKQPGVLAPLLAGLTVTFILLGGGKRPKRRYVVTSRG